MADGFDSEEILYNMIQTSGVTTWKGRSHLDEQGEHVVIRSVGSNNLEVCNVAQVAVNIYVPKAPDGLVNRTRIKQIRTTIIDLINAAPDPEGYYCVVDQSFSTLLEDAKEGFDCFTIRYELTLNA